MAVWVKQSGRPVSIAITPGGGSLVTITDILSAQPIDDIELIKHNSGNKQAPLNLQGNKLGAIQVKTTDIRAQAFKKGMYCSSVVLVCEGVKIADPGTVDNTDADMTATLLKCTQENNSAPNAEPGGKPGEIDLMFVMSQDPSDGTVGSLAIAFA